MSCGAYDRAPFRNPGWGEEFGEVVSTVRAGIFFLLLTEGSVANASVMSCEVGG